VSAAVTKPRTTTLTVPATPTVSSPTPSIGAGKTPTPGGDPGKGVTTLPKTGTGDLGKGVITPPDSKGTPPKTGTGDLGKGTTTDSKGPMTTNPRVDGVRDLSPPRDGKKSEPVRPPMKKDDKKGSKS